jgi:hypothetical protein
MVPDTRQNWTPKMTKLHIIVGSTRDGRAAEPVAQWV